ncbi:hypothetical protein R3P38DRAFT_3620529 [Favolaschia claudopus]|uniref:Glycosyl hydrolase family 31 C-terminal domain-containing protein n=1 Tax=Favolaschia claudopus TaxID=2862362 RepID=A0AAW0DCV4_9AGAR
MATIYQVAMVGADICADNTTEHLCSRWAMLFIPSCAIYRLLHCFYTAFHKASLQGTPVVSPLWFKYPKDTATYALELQWLFGDSVLVSPVGKREPLHFLRLFHVHPDPRAWHVCAAQQRSYTEIPVYIKGGSVLPLRAKLTTTTSELRETDFQFVVASGTDGSASGSLYIDDGVSVTQKAATEFNTLTVTGHFGYKNGVKTSRVRFLNIAKAPLTAFAEQGAGEETNTKELDVTIGQPFMHGFIVTIL